jgi:hypothetical protein
VTSLREVLLRSSGYLGHIPIQSEEEVDEKYEFLECLGEYVVEFSFAHTVVEQLRL